MSEQLARAMQTDTSFSQPAILVVEDEPLIRLSLAEELRSAGFSVTEAASGDEARRIIGAGQQFDIMLTDLEVPPGPSGLELATYLHLMLPRTAVVLVTAHQISNSDRVLVDGYCVKPVDYGRLVDQVRSLIASRNFGGS
jgi:CheY-like chemotaxis protein